MKTDKLIFLTLAFLLSVFFNSCVEDGDFSVPKSIGNETEPILTGTQVTFSSVKAKMAQSGGLGTYNINEDIYLIGYVVSSDRTGNFFEELIIQNTPLDLDLEQEARMGLKILIDVNDLGNKYNFGRKVYLKLGGLTVSEDSGVTAIGKLNGNNEFSNIEGYEIDQFLLRSKEVLAIKPKVTTIAALNANDLNTLVKFDEVQFSDDAFKLTFAGEETDEFSGERRITSCKDGNSILLSTSTFSDFKSEVVPSGSGTITAVYGRDFFGNTNILTLNKTEDINFKEERCDVSENLTSTLTIKELRALYNGRNIVFPPGANQIIEGYVVSSDRKGNFFKNIFIQDKPENPSAAIQILADENNLFQDYPIGSKVIVKLDRLYLGEAISSEVLSLGYREVDNNRNEVVGRIERGDLSNFLINTGITESIVPTKATLNNSGITIDKLENGVPVDEDNDNSIDQIPAPQGILIKVNNVQIPRGSRGQAYAFYNGTDSANRIIESCDTGSATRLRNSGFADFANQPFPVGSGTIIAVLTQFRGSNQLLIRTTDDVDLKGERCDPDFLDCTGDSGGDTIIFSEDFENFNNYTTEDWDNINIDNTSTDWFISGFSGNNYSRISAFRSGNTDANVWLVSPKINLDNTTNEQLLFDIQSSYDNGTNLSVFIATNYDSDPTTANWQPLDAIIPSGPSNGFGNFETVGPINISCVSGSINIGFFYKGSDPNATTRYHIDNVIVTGK